MTGTSFTSRQWSIKDESPDKNNKSEKERLEEACWFGVVKEILPELFHQSANEEKVFLWQIMEGKSFLELDMGEALEPIEPGGVHQHGDRAQLLTDGGQRGVDLRAVGDIGGERQFGA